MRYARHGHRGNEPTDRTPTYNSWRKARERVYNPNAEGYKYYGGRGVEMCNRWDSFEDFLFDMGERPEGTTIDRINPFGNYEPTNCRWSSRQVQANNKRRRAAGQPGNTVSAPSLVSWVVCEQVVMVRQGVTLSIRCGVSRSSIERIYQSGCILL